MRTTAPPPEFDYKDLPDFGTDGLCRFFAVIIRDALTYENPLERIADVLEAHAKEFDNHPADCDCDYCLR